MGNEKRAERAAKPAAEKPAGRAAKRSKSQSIEPADLVEKALRRIADRIDGEEMKATVGDLIRLLQMQHDIEADEPREVTATWIKSEEKPASEK
jgi:hypothetical protein